MHAHSEQGRQCNLSHTAFGPSSIGAAVLPADPAPLLFLVPLLLLLLLLLSLSLSLSQP